MIMLWLIMRTLYVEGELISSESFEWSQSADDFAFIEAGAKTNGSLCLIAPKAAGLRDWHIAFDTYLIFLRAKGQKKRVYYKQGEGQRYVFDEVCADLYNFTTKETEKTFDVMAISQHQPSNKMWAYGSDIDAQIIGGRRYL